MNYDDLNDYELLDYIAENNDDASEIMFKKYQPLIVSIAKKMQKNAKNCGLELSDLVQEGRLGLSNAIDYFDTSAEYTFYTYAKVCIERKIASSIKFAERNKRKSLNESLYLDSDAYNGNAYLLKFIKNDDANPENIVINEENTSLLIENASKVLTDLERQVFELKVSGFSYKEIGDFLEKSRKDVDNALQRIRKKLKPFLKEE